MDGRIYKALYLKQLTDECAEIESCKALLTTLKAQKPLGSNYRFYEFVGPSKRTGDKIIRQIYREFGCFSTASFFSNKKVIYKTHHTFGVHMKISGLKSECELMLSEAQGLMIDKLEQLRNEKIEKLSTQLELKRSHS